MSWKTNPPLSACDEGSPVPKMAGNELSLKTLNSWSHKKLRRCTCSLTASLTCAFLPSANGHFGEHDRIVHSSPLTYRHSVTSDRMQEILGTCINKSTDLATIKFKSTHNTVLGGNTAILRNAVRVSAPGSGDRRAFARFRTGEPSDDNYVLHGQNVRSSNTYEDGNSPGHSGTVLGCESRLHSKWSLLAGSSVPLSTPKISLRLDRPQYSIPYSNGALPKMPRGPWRFMTTRSTNCFSPASYPKQLTAANTLSIYSRSGWTSSWKLKTIWSRIIL